LAAHLQRLPAQLAWPVAVTWLPLVVLGVWTGRLNALVCQPAVHVRLRVAAPVFLILDQLFAAICQYTLGQAHLQSFVSAQAQQQVDGLLRSAARLADSLIHPRALWCSGRRERVTAARRASTYPR
jgi:hypothetical protein